MDFFNLIANPNWVRRKIIVSLLINKSYSVYDVNNMPSRYTTTRIWRLRKSEFGILVFLEPWILVNIRGAGTIPSETVHISLIPFLEEHRSRQLLRSSLHSLSSRAYFVINSVSPFWNAVMGWNCFNVSNLLLVCYPHPSLIQERCCWDADFCMVIQTVLHLSTTFPWVPPWQAWIVPDSKLEGWVIFPAQGFREKESRIFEQYLGYSDLA